MILTQNMSGAGNTAVQAWLFDASNRARARASALASTLQGELSTARLYCFRGAENFINNMHYVNRRVFDEDIKIQFKTANKYRIFWTITGG